MKFGPEERQAQEKTHKRWIVLDNVAQASERDIPMSTGYTEQNTGNRYFGDVGVNKRLDIASTALMNTCLKGTVDTDAQIDLSYAGDDQAYYEKINLTQVLVTHYEVMIDGDGNSQESLTLTFVHYEQ